MRRRASEYVRAFEERTGAFEVIYASKAFPATAALRVMREEGLSVDVASGGELHLALAAGFDPARIHLHGNNKTKAELRYAFESGVGHLILDSFDEIELADALLDRSQKALIRVTPGIKPSTHDYVQTGQLDSKFGFGLADGLAERAVELVRQSDHLELVGLHAHIGSQIFELEPYVKAIEVIADFCDAADLEPELLNVGGGLGIAYLDTDEPPAIENYVDVKVRGVQQVFDPVPRILVEPGRSLVGNAGITAYRVGTVKEIPGVRTYVAVDGGMSDNLRPMLYGAHYEALIADRAGEAPDTLATIAGMHCESGDVLVRDMELAAPRVGDVLVTPATGAYGHAMANNYNGKPRPPVIFSRDGEARVVVRRETWDDLLRRDE
jgi:diaminopimelate decarboxylase